MATREEAEAGLIASKAKRAEIVSNRSKYGTKVVEPLPAKASVAAKPTLAPEGSKTSIFGKIIERARKPAGFG